MSTVRSSNALTVEVSVLIRWEPSPETEKAPEGTTQRTLARLLSLGKVLADLTN